MQLLDLSLPTPAENLALDEALLDQAESSPEPRDVLRLWESPTAVVVLGRSSQLAAEVNRAACQELNIPVLRRSSGGAAIVAGPGCLMYAVILSYALRPELRSLDVAHQFVLETILRALAPLAKGLARQGTSDLAIGTSKFSGNSVRCKRRTLLYHGTLLYDFPLELIETCLTMPPRQPEYRHERAHRAFVTNLPASAQALRAALAAAFSARQPQRDWPRAQVGELVRSRYSQPGWNLQR